MFSACRCDGRRKQRGSAAPVTIAQQPGRAQITDSKRQDPSPPDALDPGFHCARTHWIRGFMAFQRARSAQTVLRMVPVLPESGFRDHAPGRCPFVGQAASRRIRYADPIVKD